MVGNRTSHQKEILNRLTEYQRRRGKEVQATKCHKKSEVKKHSLEIIVSHDLEPDNILKIFLNFTKFEPHYSYKIYSYKKECTNWNIKALGIRILAPF